MFLCVYNRVISGSMANRYGSVTPLITLLRSSHHLVAAKTGVLKNLVNFTGKHLC